MTFFPLICLGCREIVAFRLESDPERDIVHRKDDGAVCGRIGGYRADGESWVRNTPADPTYTTVSAPPWRFDDKDSGRIMSAKGEHLATVARVKDAYLIVQAPELLANVRALLGVVDEWVGHRIDAAGEVRAARARAHVVIAKIEGT